MKTTLLIKNIYLEGFRNLGNFMVRNYFKGFMWFTMSMFSIVVYAFLFRVFTGFAFD